MAADEDSAPVIIYSTGKAGLPDSEKTWAKHLQDAGYITQAIGKNYYQTFIYVKCLKWYLYLRDFVLVPCIGLHHKPESTKLSFHYWGKSNLSTFSALA